MSCFLTTVIIYSVDMVVFYVFMVSICGWIILYRQSNDRKANRMIFKVSGILQFLPVILCVSYLLAYIYLITKCNIVILKHFSKLDSFLPLICFRISSKLTIVLWEIVVLSIHLNVCQGIQSGKHLTVLNMQYIIIFQPSSQYTDNSFSHQYLCKFFRSRYIFINFSSFENKICGYF